MSFFPLFIFTVLFSLLVSCSTIQPKDCSRNMKELGLSHGRMGSPKKYTDELRDVCLAKHPQIDLESYDKAFYMGWMEYCLPNKAFEMGKKADTYVSYCPPEREATFRRMYLLGKNHAELKDVEEEILDKMEELKPTITTSTDDLDEYNELQKELDKTKREIHALEVEGNKNSFILH